MNKPILVAGIDVCKDRVVCAVLTEVPDDPQSYLLDLTEINLPASMAGVKQLLSLGIDEAILEPTGVNYSKLWIRSLTNAGVTVRLVGHVKLHGYRKSLELPDKDDLADALALACYGIAKRKNERSFVNQPDEATGKVLDLYYRLRHISRLQSPQINRIKQDLAWAWPEKAKTRLDARGLWDFLAGDAVYQQKRYERELNDSIGLGVTEHIRANARRLVALLNEEDDLRIELTDAMNSPQFLPYRSLLAKYCLPLLTEAILLAKIYPFSKWLGENGEPIERLTRSKKDKERKRKTLKRLSLRRFKKSLGVSIERIESGDKKKQYKAGSRQCGKSIWIWIDGTIAKRKTRNGGVKQANEPTIVYYRERYDALIVKHGNDRAKARSRLASEFVTDLFYDLTHNLTE